MSQESGTFASFGEGPATATAATKIIVTVKPRRRKKTKVSTLVYTSLGTAHTVTALRPLGSTTISAVAAGAQGTIVLVRDPGLYAANNLADGLPVPSVADNGLAASDYVAVELPDGNIHVSLVTSFTVLTVVLTTVLPAGGALSGARVWFFGVEADTDPNTGKAHPSWAPPVSATTTYKNDAGGPLTQSMRDYQPILFISNNLTAAGIIATVGGVYGP